MKILAVVSLILFNLKGTVSQCQILYMSYDSDLPVIIARDFCIYCRFYVYPNQLLTVTDTYYEIIRNGTTFTIRNDFDRGFRIGSSRQLSFNNGLNYFFPGDVLICISPDALSMNHTSGRITMNVTRQYFYNPSTSPINDTTIDVIEGSNLNITCLGNPLDSPGIFTSYEWLNPANTPVAGTYTRNTPSELTINNITRTSMGMYTCQSWRYVFNHRSTRITINVLYPTAILTIDSSGTILESGSTYSVNCTFDPGNPPPTITWQRNGTTLTSNINITTTSTSSLLTIPSLQGLQDSGNYQCIASNNINNVTSNNVTLTVQVVPDQVINLTATNVSESSVTLEWTLGFDGYANISGVRVEYIATGNYHMPHSGNESFSGSTISQGTITGLQPFTNYTFNVYVINSVGESSPVQLIVITLSLIPNAPTLNSVIPDNSTSLRVMWTDNTNSSNQSMVTSYRVVYHIAGQPSTSTNVTVAVTSVILTSLMKGTNYTVTVYATNSGGEGLASNSITNMTDVDPPSAVNNLILVPFDDSICVSWNTTVNDDGGQSISGFKLYYKYSYNTSNILAGQFGQTTSYYRINNLPQINSYTVSIVAFNVLGGNGDNTSNITTTGVSIPITMSINLMLTRVTAFTASLTWSSSSLFSSFLLQYKPTGSGWSSSNEVNVTGMTNYTIDNLTPQTNYDARLVMSFNNKCLLEATTPINISTIVLKIIINDDGTVNGTAFVTDKVVLQCTLDTGEAPPSNVIWMRDNGSPIPSNVIMNNTIEFSNVSVTDTANYTCSFQNVSYTFTLTIIETLPDPAINLTATNVSKSSVRLEWTLGFDGYANISGVRVGYIATGNYHMPHSGNESFSGSTISQGTITGLQPFTNYTFNVYVINSVGESSPVQLIVMTLPLVPNAPTVDSVIPDNSTSLRVMWTDNTNSSTQSMVTSYRVVYHIAGQPSTSTNVTVAVTSVILTSLMKGTNYTVTVYATNSGGEGLASNSITNMTDVDSPSAVNNLILVPFDDSICVSWNTTVNDDGGQSISGFKLYYKYSYNTSNILAGQFGKTTSYYRIDNLSQINFYNVSIVAFNMLGGDGDDTSNTTTTGVSIPITMSVNLTLTRVTAFTAFLTYTWSSSSLFSSFLLQYKPTGSGWSSSNEVNVTGMTNYTIDNLTPQTNYDARLVMSFNNKCLLEATSPINISTIVLKIIINDDGTVNGTAFVTDKVVLQCTLDTGEAPPSNVIWMRDNGSPIPSNEIMNNNTLEFCASVTDTANYTCSFQNVSYTFTLTVKEHDQTVPSKNTEIGFQAVITLYSSTVGALIFVSIVVFIVIIGLTLRLVKIKISYGSKSKQLTDKSQNNFGTMPVVSNSTFSSTFSSAIPSQVTVNTSTDSFFEDVMSS